MRRMVFATSLIILLFLFVGCSISSKGKMISGGASVGAAVGGVTAYVLRLNPYIMIGLGSIVGAIDGNNAYRERQSNMNKIDKLNKILNALRKKNKNLREVIREMEIYLSEQQENRYKLELEANEYRCNKYSIYTAMRKVANRKELIINEQISIEKYINVLENKDYTLQERDTLFILKNYNSNLNRHYNQLSSIQSEFNRMLNMCEQ